MSERHGAHDDMEVARYEKSGEGRHHHRGRSSESLLDKNAILSALAVQPGQTILDAGCGNGYMSREFAGMVGLGGKVYALDPDEIAIDLLRREAGGANIVPTVGDITVPTGLPACAFDIIYLSTVVHGFSPAQKRGLAVELRRLLAPCGRVAVVEIAKRPTPFGPPLEIRLSPEELTAALGLKPLALADIGEHFYLQVFGNAPDSQALS